MSKPSRPAHGRLSSLRVMSALLFDRLCSLSGLTALGLCKHLGEVLEREGPIQATTLRTWRSGTAPVPLEALMAVADLARFRFPGFEILMLGEAIDDENRRRDAYNRLIRHRNSRHGQ